jgi:hypothetical protein
MTIEARKTLLSLFSLDEDAVSLPKKRGEKIRTDGGYAIAYHEPAAIHGL